MTLDDIQEISKSLASIGGGLYVVAVGLGATLRALGLGNSRAAALLNTVALDLDRVRPKAPAPSQDGGQP